MARITIIVCFTSESDADSAFKNENLIGTRVSQILPRYAVEIYSEKEKKITKILTERYQAKVL